jgi:hypothetical protein
MPGGFIQIKIRSKSKRGASEVGPVRSTLLDGKGLALFHFVRPGGAMERPPNRTVVTHCECDSADC